MDILFSLLVVPGTMGMMVYLKISYQLSGAC